MKATKAQKTVQQRRLGRRVRVRKKIAGTPERPRLAVHRSNRYISVQVIDDVSGRTLCSATSAADDIKYEGSGRSIAAAKAVGEKIAATAKDSGVSHVVFDKGWYRYHGRIKALAEAAREAGLQF